MGCIFGSGNMPDTPEDGEGGAKSSKGKQKSKETKTKTKTSSSAPDGGKILSKKRTPSVVYKIQIEHFISPKQEEQLEIDLRAGTRDKSPMKLDYVLQQAGQLYQSPLHPALLAIIIRVSIALYDDCSDHENGQIILQEGFDNANYQMQEDRENGLLPDDDEALDDENRQLQEIRELLDHMRVITWAWSAGESTPDVDLHKWIIEPRPLSVDSFSRPDGMIQFNSDLSDDEHAAVLLAGGETVESATSPSDVPSQTSQSDDQVDQDGDDDPPPLQSSDDNDGERRSNEQPPSGGGEQQAQQVEQQDEQEQPATAAVSSSSSSPPLSSREIYELIQSAKTAENTSDNVMDSVLKYVDSADGIDGETNDAILEYCEFLRQNEKESSAVSLEARLQERREKENVDS